MNARRFVRPRGIRCPPRDAPRLAHLHPSITLLAAGASGFFDLDPVLRAPGAIWPIASLGHDAFDPWRNYRCRLTAGASVFPSSSICLARANHLSTNSMYRALAAGLRALLALSEAFLGLTPTVVCFGRHSRMPSHGVGKVTAPPVAVRAPVFRASRTARGATALRLDGRDPRDGYATITNPAPARSHCCGRRDQPEASGPRGSGAYADPGAMNWWYLAKSPVHQAIRGHHPLGDCGFLVFEDLVQEAWGRRAHIPLPF